MSEHTIAELSALSGLSVRTIRYYLAQGLIPSAGKDGPATRYPDATLARLRLTQRLRDAHLPLAEIRKQLLALSDDEVLALSGAAAGPEPEGTALDYVRSVLGGGRSELTPPPAALSPMLAMPLAARMPPPRTHLLRRAELAEPTADAAGPPADASTFGQRSQWERVAITPDIELHLRRPLSRRDNRLVERLVAFARQLQEDQP